MLQNSNTTCRQHRIPGTELFCNRSTMDTVHLFWTDSRHQDDLHCSRGSGLTFRTRPQDSRRRSTHAPVCVVRVWKWNRRIVMSSLRPWVIGKKDGASRSNKRHSTYRTMIYPIGDIFRRTKADSRTIRDRILCGWRRGKKTQLLSRSHIVRISWAPTTRPSSPGGRRRLRLGYRVTVGILLRLWEATR